jgi:hypothetical protein
MRVLMSDQPPASPSSAAPGDPYCGNCGYSLKGLEDSSKCPECGKPIVQVLMRKGFVGRVGKRYRSNATLFGLPIIDVAMGPSEGEMRGKARGIIAIGDSALGWIAIGGIARGIVALGGVAIGVFPVGGLAFGVLAAAGGLAVSLGLASGGLAIGTVSSGGGAVGIIAQGGVALGVFARGGSHFGNTSSQAFEHVHLLLGGWPPQAWDAYRPFVLTFVAQLLVVVLVHILVIPKLHRRTKNNSGTSHLI